MPIRKPKTFQESYRFRASMPSIHELSGRRDQKITDLVSSAIFAAMDVTPADILVDVGCGDGTLLRLCKCTAIGILPSAEEVGRVQQERPDLDVRLGMAERLPLPSGFATKVICNGVVLILATEENVINALAEISRIAKPGACIFIGEIPHVDEMAQRRGDYGTSVLKWLRTYQKTRSLRHFAGAVKTVCKAAFTSTQFFLDPTSIYFASPERFIALAQQSGLKHIKHFPSPSAATRYDYIFAKQ